MSQDEPPRTEFQSLKKNVVLSVLFLIISLGMLGLAPVPFMRATYAMDYVIGVLLIGGGLVGLLFSISGLIVWIRPVWLVFTPEGVEFGRREDPMRLPWAAIGVLRITDRWANGAKMPWRRLPDASGLGIRFLVVFPADDVADPRAGRWKAAWDTDRWQLCATHTMDGTEEEIVAGIAATAPSSVRVEVDPVEIRRNS